ncbi:PREDICTED: uncharacterized protein LOC104815418 [Tarenaya hassleriana]|uniref:uncharacterized protein LOC104815418 n=1 Tax=Tarenaya hassleriana TaxID=28532 RepID=UPI00053C9AC9|nr:PREDICTED: uncharacterized protein LOC104815418 [Tarenaya hassleriana]
MALEGRNKLGFIDGTLAQPPDSDPESKLWKKNNFMVCSWIMNSVSEQIAESLLYFKKANDMWKNLLNRFQQADVSRRYRIEQKLNSLRQGHDDVSTYYTKLVTIWEELKSVQTSPICSCGTCSCGVDKKWRDLFEEDFVFQFLCGLNDVFEPVRDHIILMDPLPNLAKASGIVVKHEQQKMIKNPILTDTSVFQTPVQPQHTENVAAVAGGFYKPRQRPLCTHCGLYGHTVHKCYKLHGYPPGYIPRNPQSQNSVPVQKTFTPQGKNNFQNKGTIANVITEPVMDQNQVSDVGALSTQQLHQLFYKLGAALNISSPSITENGAPENVTSSGNHLILSSVSADIHMKDTNDTWIIDSGATTHSLKQGKQ